MSIDEESFPYDSLLDAMDNELNTDFHMVSAEGFKTFGCSSTFISEPSQSVSRVNNVSEADGLHDKNVTVLMDRVRNTTYSKKKDATSSSNLTGLGRATSLDCVLTNHKEGERAASYQDIHPLHIRRRYQNVESKVGKMIAEYSAVPVKRAKRTNPWPESETGQPDKYMQLMHEQERLKSCCNYLNERLQEKNVNTVRLKQNLEHVRIQLMQAQDKIRDLEISVRQKQHTHMYHANEYLNVSVTSDRHTIGTQTGIPTPPTPQPMHPAFLLLSDNNNFGTIGEVPTMPTHRKYLSNKLQLPTSSKSSSTILHSLSSSTGGDRSDTYCITSNDEPHPSGDSRSRRSSFRCSSDSAIEIDALQMPVSEERPRVREQKLHKERLSLFQRRSRHAYNNINANTSYEAENGYVEGHTRIIYKSDNLRDLNGVHGRFRTLNANGQFEDTRRGLIPVEIQGNNCTYFIKNNRLIGVTSGNNDDDEENVVDRSNAEPSTTECWPKACLAFLKPCANCLAGIGSSRNTSLVEMNLLKNQSTYSEPQPR